MTDIDCPRAQSAMTPCVARDGALAVSDPIRGHSGIPSVSAIIPPRATRPDQPGVCVGCSADPRELLRDLGARYAPAKPTGNPALDRRREAARLKECVAAYVETNAA